MLGPTNDLATWLGYYGIKVASLVAGFLGASVWLGRSPQMSRWQMFTSVMSGALIAGYGEPLVSYFLNLPQPLQPPVAFFLGLAGMVLAAGIIKVAEALPEIAKGWLERFIGGRQ